MKEIILEGKNFTDGETAQNLLKEIFEFPDYYGKNLNAFWDCITDYAISCFQEKSEVKIIWKDFDISKKNLGEEADILLELFEDAKEQYGGFTIEVIH